MLFFFHGPDEFRTKQKINALRDKFKSSVDPSGNNIHYLDGTDLDWSEFFQYAAGQGMFSSKKLLIVRDPWASDTLEDYEDQLLNLINNLKDTQDENYLVFWRPGKLTKDALSKRLQKIKYAQEFPELSGAELRQWLQATAQHLGFAISSAAVEILITLAGTDTWTLYQEMTKLKHSGTKDISEQQVYDIVSGEIPIDIFAFVDACGNQRKPQAHQLLERALQQGTEPLYILSMIIRQFRLLIQAQDQLQRNSNNFSLATSLGLPPFIAQKIASQARSFSAHHLQKLYRQLEITDNQIKFSDAPAAALTALIEKI